MVETSRLVLAEDAIIWGPLFLILLKIKKYFSYKFINFGKGQEHRKQHEGDMDPFVPDIPPLAPVVELEVVSLVHWPYGILVGVGTLVSSLELGDGSLGVDILVVSANWSWVRVDDPKTLTSSLVLSVSGCGG